MVENEIMEEASRMLERSSKMKEAVKYSLQHQIDGPDELDIDAVSGFLGVLFELTLSSVLIKCEAGEDLTIIMQKLLKTLESTVFGEDFIPSEDSQEIFQLLSCFLDSKGEA